MFKHLQNHWDGFLNKSEGPKGYPQFINNSYQTSQIIDNLLLSSDSGCQIGPAIQTVDETGHQYRTSPFPHSDKVCQPDISPDLTSMASQCASSNVDQLLSIKNPYASVGCGWLYTPPTQGSPYPVVSSGFLGTNSGPIQALNPASHRKWFFDLQKAKSTALLDRCKALKTCTDVDQDVYQGVCGYCTNTNQGVPINSAGNPLYPTNPIGNCDATAIVRNGSQCPPPPPPAAGPQPILDRTCEPVNGTLSMPCLRRTVLSAGCTDNGALALALTGMPTNSRDYMDQLSGEDSAKIYNRHTNPPLNLDLFRQGRATVNQVLQEARNVYSNTNQPVNTAIGAAARDLCLQRGAIDQYDICGELSDSTAPPYSLRCLQTLFLKMGGKPKGRYFPTIQNLAKYNTMRSLGTIKQYWNSRMQQMGKMNNAFLDYATQKEAVQDILGIQLEDGIKRAPYTQGIEVFWFVPEPGNAIGITGFLKRTIETDILFLRDGPSSVAQIGGGAYGCAIQLTDVRTPTDFTARFRVRVDDGFWIAVNQPAGFDREAMASWGGDDKLGFFKNNNLQGPTTYESQKCSTFHASTPNIMKIFYQDAGGGGNAFQVTPIACKGILTMGPPNYSLTCEIKAPFLTFEVSPISQRFEELRNPGMFSKFTSTTNVEYHLTAEKKLSMPGGNKGFIRINSQNSEINLSNIAYQSWKSLTMLFRFSSRATKEVILNLTMGSGRYCYIIAMTDGQDRAKILIEHNIEGKGQASLQPTSWVIPLNTWYFFIVNNNKTNNKTEFTIRCISLDNALLGQAILPDYTFYNRQSLYPPNGTNRPVPGQAFDRCLIKIGARGTNECTYDVGWVHFFDYIITNKDMTREAKADWIYTTFPSTYDTYNS